MDRKLRKIIDNLHHHHGEAVDTVIVEKAFNFLEMQAANLQTETRDLAIHTGLDLAGNHSLKPVALDIIILVLLSELIRLRPEVVQLIKEAVSPEIYLLSKAYDLFIRADLGNIHNRSLKEHTLATIIILAEIKPDTASLCAALLREGVDQGKIDRQLVATEFGTEIMHLIDSTNKLKSFSTIEEPNNQDDVKQTFFTMSQDHRVIVLKICSLIDWLNHLDDINEKHRTRLATEAMEIYAPIADILGVWRLKWQLEDAAFKYLQPTEFEKIEKRFNIDEKQNREKYIEKTKRMVMKLAKEKGINCTIDGRFKHFYSIYQKMHEKNKKFNDLNDVFALRVIVDNVDDCYRMLGLIHSLWRPKAKRIKDYIASPKSNNYRSLHTTVLGLNNRLTEFQIRTTAMHDEARFGIAAHWAYKNKQHLMPDWVRSMLHLKNKDEQVDQSWKNITTEILADKIFVYTPKGDIIPLPANSTPIDFAYHIHTEVGHHCCAAKVNNVTVPLSTTLKNEDRVEIVTDPNQTGPYHEWRSFCVSAQARKALEKFFEETHKNFIEDVDKY
jgi:GTP pyrophosphokinase